MKLTARETQILKLMAAGHGSEAIGDKLQLSKRTVETHLLNARKKIGALNTAHALVLALKQKIIALEDL